MTLNQEHEQREEEQENRQRRRKRSKETIEKRRSRTLNQFDATTLKLKERNRSLLAEAFQQQQFDNCNTFETKRNREKKIQKICDLVQKKLLSDDDGEENNLYLTQADVIASFVAVDEKLAISSQKTILKNKKKEEEEIYNRLRKIMPKKFLEKEKEEEEEKFQSSMPSIQNKTNLDINNKKN